MSEVCPPRADDGERERSGAGVFLLRDSGELWAMLLSRHIDKHFNEICLNSSGIISFFFMLTVFSICCRMGGAFYAAGSFSNAAVFYMQPISFCMHTVSPLMRGAKTTWVHGSREVLHCYVTPAYH